MEAGVKEEPGYEWIGASPPGGNHTHAINSGADVGVMVRVLTGDWFTYVAGGGLFMWQNYYGHGPLNGLTKEERVLLNLKEILAWNMWKLIR